MIGGEHSKDESVLLLRRSRCGVERGENQIVTMVYKVVVEGTFRASLPRPVASRRVPSRPIASRAQRPQQRRHQYCSTYERRRSPTGSMGAPANSRGLVGALTPPFAWARNALKVFPVARAWIDHRERHALLALLRSSCSLEVGVNKRTDDRAEDIRRS